MIRVLVVDDSETMRKLISHILDSDPEFKVVDTASDGVEAVRKVELLRPDVVTMDLVMPRMDGFEATRRIMQDTPVPIVVVSSSYSAEEVNRSFLAVGSGALAMVDKPSGLGDPRYAEKVKELRTTVKLMSEVKVIGRRYPTANAAAPKPTRVRSEEAIVKVVGIGASTGGPQTLVAILRTLPKDYPLPLLIVQHIAPGFARGLADWLQDATPLDVCLATNDDIPSPGRCHIAPTGFHMGVNRERKLFLSSEPPRSGLRPSIDYLFHTMAAVYGSQAAGVVLTGMGQDGVSGLLAMRSRGAVTIAQDAESAIIASMPQTAAQQGGAKHVLTPDKIASKLMELAWLATHGNNLNGDNAHGDHSNGNHALTRETDS